jgi:hypothetical protein
LPNAPVEIGMTKRKIIVTPCIVKTSSNAWGLSRPLSGRISWVRISSASTPPAAKNASDVNR